MKYLEITIHTTEAGVEFLTAYLMKQGITGTWVESPSTLFEILDKKNPYDWDYMDESLLEPKSPESRLKFYLDDDEAGRALWSAVKIDLMKFKSSELYGELPAGMDLGRLYAEALPVDDAAWKDNWKEHFSKVRLTDSLEVRSPYLEEDGEPAGAGVILLDPGMAFGTGTHETTALCARLMEAEDCRGKSVLDIGCGTGILSLAAAKLGSPRVVGVDIDPKAVETARENVLLNGCGNVIKIVQGDLVQGIRETADIVVANLVAELVAGLAGHVRSVLNPGGLLVVSGILLEKEALVSGALEQAGFSIETILREGDWCAIAAR